MVRFRSLQVSLLVQVSSFLILQSWGQTTPRRHYLKYINAGETSSPDSPPQFSSELPEDLLRNTGNRFVKADRICVDGLWALYNTTNYGQGAEDFSTVISVRGTDLNTCTKPGQIPVLRNVQSVHYLGNADYSRDGILIYSRPYFLGAAWTVTIGPDGNPMPLPMEINGFALGSVAITGGNSWVICGDMDRPCSSGVCVNMRRFGNLYIHRNTMRDGSIPNGWPRTVRQVLRVDSDVCSNYPSPAPLPLRSRRLAEDEAHLHFDIGP